MIGEPGRNPEGVINANVVSAAPIQVKLPDECPPGCSLEVSVLRGGKSARASAPGVTCPGSPVVPVDVTNLEEGDVELRAHLSCPAGDSGDATTLALKDTVVGVSVDPVVTPTTKPTQHITGSLSEPIESLVFTNDRFPSQQWPARADPTGTWFGVEVKLRGGGDPNTLSAVAEDERGNVATITTDAWGNPLVIRLKGAQPPPFARDDAWFRPRENGECSGIVSAVLGNDDQVPDLYLSGCHELYLSQPDGSFLLEDHSRDASGERTAIWADVNQDGNQDLLTTGYPGSPQCWLFEVDWTSHPVTFVPHDLSALVTNPEGACWLSWDGDPTPELWVQNGSGDLLLDIRDFDGFDVTSVAGLHRFVNSRRNGNWVACADFDRDQDVDVLVSDELVYLFRNEGGTFADETTTLGLSVHHDNDHKWPVVVGDVNGDGFFDLWAAEPGDPPSHRLYLWNHINFKEVAQAAGLVFPPGPAAALGDVDNDGDLDIVAVDLGPDPPRIVIAYNVPGRSLGFQIVPTDIDLSSELPRNMLLEDLDLDGDLDLILGFDGHGIAVYRGLTNCLQTGSVCDTLGEPRQDPRYLEVLVAFRTTDGHIVPQPGTVVELRETGTDGSCVPPGRLLAVRQVEGANGAGGQHSPVAHFGGVEPSRPYCVTGILPTGQTVQSLVVPRAWWGRVFVLSN